MKFRALNISIYCLHNSPNWEIANDAFKLSDNLVRQHFIVRLPLANQITFRDALNLSLNTISESGSFISYWRPIKQRNFLSRSSSRLKSKSRTNSKCFPHLSFDCKFQWFRSFFRLSSNYISEVISANKTKPIRFLVLRRSNCLLNLCKWRIKLYFPINYLIRSNFNFSALGTCGTGNRVSDTASGAVANLSVQNCRLNLKTLSWKQLLRFELQEKSSGRKRGLDDH